MHSPACSPLYLDCVRLWLFSLNFGKSPARLVSLFGMGVFKLWFWLYFVVTINGLVLVLDWFYSTSVYTITILAFGSRIFLETILGFECWECSAVRQDLWRRLSNLCYR